MKKRVIALLMAAAMVAGLTACGSGSETSPAQEPADIQMHEAAYCRRLLHCLKQDLQFPDQAPPPRTPVV